ncbi:MAG TPA: hypothetical protein VFB34_07435, partial [Chloroflexota bacterium]|nr:hypothetical protein [Chloroflexota bacterium]
GTLDRALGRAQYILAALLGLVLADFAAIKIWTAMAPITLTEIWWLLGSLAALSILVGLESIRLHFAAKPAGSHAPPGTP